MQDISLPATVLQQPLAGCAWSQSAAITRSALSVVWLLGSLQVLKLVGSPQGVVPAGSVAVLRFEFRPLEAKLHEVMLPVKLADGQLEHLRVVGRGYHPEHGLQAVPVPAQVSCPACQCPAQ